MRSSASDRETLPGWGRRSNAGPTNPATRSSPSNVWASGKRASSISASDGKNPLSQWEEKCLGSKEAITIRPPGTSTRAASASARGRSTCWRESRMTTRSNQLSLKGSASAFPSLNRARLPLLRAWASISVEASTPQTFAPRSARAAAKVPVPQPTSRVRRPSRSPAATMRSKTSHQLSSAGRMRSYDPATARKCDASLASADELIRVGHRLDGVLRRLEGGFRDEHLLRRVSERRRMRLDGRLELRLDPRGAQDRLNLLRLREVARQDRLNHPCHEAPPPRAGPTPRPSRAGARPALGSERR